MDRVSGELTGTAQEWRGDCFEDNIMHFNLRRPLLVASTAVVVFFAATRPGAVKAAGNSAAPPATDASVTAVPTPLVTSARLERPLSVSGVLNYPLLNAGVDVSYQLTDRFAVGGQLTTMLIHTELTARTRFFFLTRPQWGMYLGGNAHLIHSPLILSFPAVGFTGELGFEIRTGSLVLGFGAGAGTIWSERSEGGQPGEHWQLYPVVNIRIGRSYR